MVIFSVAIKRSKLPLTRDDIHLKLIMKPSDLPLNLYLTYFFPTHLEYIHCHFFSAAHMQTWLPVTTAFNLRTTFVHLRTSLSTTYICLYNDEDLEDTKISSRYKLIIFCFYIKVSNANLHIHRVYKTLKNNNIWVLNIEVVHKICLLLLVCSCCHGDGDPDAMTFADASNLNQRSSITKHLNGNNQFVIALEQSCTLVALCINV